MSKITSKELLKANKTANKKLTLEEQVAIIQALKSVGVLEELKCKPLLPLKK
jgi:phage gp16-like protein